MILKSKNLDFFLKFYRYTVLLENCCNQSSKPPVARLDFRQLSLKLKYEIIFEEWYKVRQKTLGKKNCKFQHSEFGSDLCLPPIFEVFFIK